MANHLLMMDERMKLLLLIGGLLGFGIGLTVGLTRSQPLGPALLQACIALYIGALLMRWWGRVWTRALQESQRERSRE
jgi:hypothetical protein